jgi:hypothetical protein
MDDGRKALTTEGTESTEAINFRRAPCEELAI